MQLKTDRELHDKLKSAGERQGWWGVQDAGILVALSGGSDSMALLTLLEELHAGPLAAAHLEHGFRGRDSQGDAEFVRSYCEKRKIPCFVRSADVTALRAKGESAEMAGRRIRYEFFFEALRKSGASFIATGHTADDAVETVLLNFFRGTGIKGLAGIEERRGAIVRPVIDCRREELRLYLRDRGIPWREDATNDENHYRRNRIRNQLIPWIRENLNESVDRAVQGLASDCRKIADDMKREAACRIAEMTREAGNAGTSLAAWDLGAARLLGDWELANALREQGDMLNLPTLDRKRLNELCRLIKRSGRWRFQWAGDVEVLAFRGMLRWCRRADLEKILDAESNPL